MKILLVAALLISAPAVAQTGSTMGNSGPASPGWQIQNFDAGVKTSDNRTLDIDRRRTAEVQAARAARKTRAAEASEARRAATKAPSGQ